MALEAWAYLRPNAVLSSGTKVRLTFDLIFLFFGVLQSLDLPTNDIAVASGLNLFALALLIWSYDFPLYSPHKKCELPGFVCMVTAPMVTAPMVLT